MAQAFCIRLELFPQNGDTGFPQSFTHFPLSPVVGTRTRRDLVRDSRGAAGPGCFDWIAAMCWFASGMRSATGERPYARNSAMASESRSSRS